MMSVLKGVLTVSAEIHCRWRFAERSRDIQLSVPPLQVSLSVQNRIRRILMYMHAYLQTLI